MGQRFTIVEARHRETPRGFQVGEGSGTSHHLQERVATPYQASHAPTRATMPTVQSADTMAGAQEEPEPNHIGGYFAEYQAYGQDLRDALLFRDFVQLKQDSKPRNHHRGHQHYLDGDTQRTVSRFHLSTFDGSSNNSAKSWVEKMDIYFQLNQMAEMEAIKLATLHLDGEA